MAATEATRQYSLLLLRNHVFDQGVRVYASSSNSAYPVTNLLNPLRTDLWMADTANSVSIEFDFGERYSYLDTSDYQSIEVHAIALVNSNIQSGQTLIYEQCGVSNTYPNWSAPTARWIITTWEQKNNVFIFALGTPSTGSYSSSARWHRIVLPTNGAGTGVNHEMGCVYLGAKLDLQLNGYPRFASDTIMTQSKTLPGGTHVTDIGSGFSTDVEILGNDMTDADIEEIMIPYLDSISQYRYILLDLFAFSSDTSKRSAGVFYGEIEDWSYEIRSSVQKSNDISFGFREAVG